MKPISIQVSAVANGFILTPLFDRAKATPDEIVLIISDAGIFHARLGEAIDEMIDHDYVGPNGAPA